LFLRRCSGCPVFCLCQAAAAKKQENRPLKKNQRGRSGVLVYITLGGPWGLGAGAGAGASRQPAGSSSSSRQLQPPGSRNPGEGPPKKKSTDPPVHLLNPRPTHPPSDFFFLDFFF
jgi:hypothetical protein